MVLNDDLVSLLIYVAITEVHLGSSSVVSCMLAVLGTQNHGCANYIPSYLEVPFSGWLPRATSWEASGVTTLGEIHKPAYTKEVEEVGKMFFFKRKKVFFSFYFRYCTTFEA